MKEDGGPMFPKRIPIEQRFWSKVQKTDSCWLWTGSKGRQGYGILFVSKHPYKTVRAHRFSWQLFYGKIPDGLDVCHHCDNPSCVRPDHLFTGTAHDNIMDAVKKGRWVVFRSFGERHGNAKLTQEQADTIWREYRSIPVIGTKKQRHAVTALGKRFGINPNYTRRIGKGELWSKSRNQNNSMI